MAAIALAVRMGSIAAMGLSAAAVAVAMACTTDGGRVDAGPAGEDRLEHEAEFWRMLTICGESAENHPTITAMAEVADAVVVGRIVGAAAGNTIQGDAAEDFYTEVNLQMEVAKVLRHASRSSFELSLILPTVVRPGAVESALDTLRMRLPQGRVVLLVRMRHDLDSENLYRLVTDQGLWTTTSRGPLDNPITDECHFIEARSNPFLEGVTTLDALIEHLSSR